MGWHIIKNELFFFIILQIFSYFNGGKPSSLKLLIFKLHYRDFLFFETLILFKYF